MKEIDRNDSYFSMCGLNCGVCPMQIHGDCGGCFTGSPCYEGCPIVHCEHRKDNMEYCFECDKFPCDKYDGFDSYDSLIPHINCIKDMEKAKKIGIDKYLNELKEKRQILEYMIDEYDCDNNDIFYCTAANLMSVSDFRKVYEEAENVTKELNQKEKSKYLIKRLKEVAKEHNIEIKLRR